MKKAGKSALGTGALVVLSALILCALLGLLARWLFAPAEAPPQAAAETGVAAVIRPSSSAAPTPPSETPAALSAEVEAALAMAERLQPLHAAVYDEQNSHLGLPAETMAAMLELLGAEAVAVDVARSLSPLGTERLAAFSEAAEQGESAALRLYELCPDGGFICHALESGAQGLWVTQTRLVWTGGAPAIGYCARYAVTALELTNSRFRYDWFMPDNIEGGNHDGHIDTWLELDLMP